MVLGHRIFCGGGRSSVTGCSECTFVSGFFVFVLFARRNHFTPSQNKPSCFLAHNVRSSFNTTFLGSTHLGPPNKQILPSGKLEGHMPTLPCSWRLHLWSNWYSSFLTLLKCLLLCEDFPVQPGRIQMDLCIALGALCSNSLFMRLFACKGCEHPGVYLCPEEYLTHSVALLNILS